MNVEFYTPVNKTDPVSLAKRPGYSTLRALWLPSVRNHGMSGAALPCSHFTPSGSSNGLSIYMSTLQMDMGRQSADRTGEASCTQPFLPM